MSFYAAPNQQRHLRACMKFQRDGCPNCETSLQLRGNSEQIAECTSQVFEGLIAVRDPSVSWVARWQRLDNYVPGTYAMKVTGILPDYIISGLEASGIQYVPRDGTTGEEDA